MKEILAYRVAFDEDYGHHNVLIYNIREVHIREDEEDRFDWDYYENDCKYLRSFEEAKEFVVKEINETIDLHKKSFELGLELANGIDKEDMIDGTLYSSKLNSKTSK